MRLTITIDTAPSLRRTGRPRRTASAGKQLSRGDAAWLKTRLEELCRKLGFSQGTWALQIISDTEMKSLHCRFLGIPATTDVMTFDMRPSPPTADRDCLQLDTAICIDEAQRQCARRNIPLRSELLLYAVHSLLHVSGYDDRTPAAARRMHRREDELLEALGVGLVYQSVGGAK